MQTDLSSFGMDRNFGQLRPIHIVTFEEIKIYIKRQLQKQKLLYPKKGLKINQLEKIKYFQVTGCICKIFGRIEHA